MLGIAECSPTLVPRTHNLGTVSLDYSKSEKILTFLKSVTFVNSTLVDSLLYVYRRALSPFTMVPTASFEYSVVESALKLET